MRKPPVLATRLLMNLVATDETLVGDLVEEYQAGRSRVWYWRQVFATVWLQSFQRISAHPVRTLFTIAAGWSALLLAFFTAGDRSAEALAGWVWQWDRPSAYATGFWWPFQITAAVVSYSGFALSAIIVGRMNKHDGASMLVAYTGSIFVVLAASAAVIEILTRQNGAVPVPHTLFYIVSVALPFHWRSGLLLAPMIVLITGLLARTTTDPHQPEPKPL